MIDKKRVYRDVGATLVRQGFSKKRTNWYLRSSEVIVVIGLQKAPWEPQYYVNVGLGLTSLGAAEFPDPWDCHVYGRLEKLVPGSMPADWFGVGLDEPEERLVTLLKSLEHVVIPFLRTCLELNAVLRLGRDGCFKGTMVRKEAWWLWEPSARPM